MVISASLQETKIPASRVIALPPRKEPVLINPGAVGQPRDRVPLASFCIFDDAAWSVAYERIPYDIAASQRLIKDAGLPRSLGDRLALGN
jgi:diadenosine tetraphosphatase ApaH/serine/threonine PP2A family protein phosphatase